MSTADVQAPAAHASVGAGADESPLVRLRLADVGGSSCPTHGSGGLGIHGSPPLWRYPKRLEQEDMAESAELFVATCCGCHGETDAQSHELPPLPLAPETIEFLAHRWRARGLT
jgi:hypothetical protein